MAFQLSPGINVSEVDLTTVVPAVSTTEGAIAGVFQWGPVDKFLLVDSESTLAQRYGKPNNDNFETWFTAADFLSYGNKLYVSRAISNTTLSAIANTNTANVAAHVIKNEDDYITKQSSFSSNVQFIAKYPGAIGNSLKVSVCGSETQFNSTINLANTSGNTLFGSANTRLTLAVGSDTALVTLANTATLAGNSPEAYANTVASQFSVGDIVEVGNTSIGKQYLKIINIGSIQVVNTAGTNTGVGTFTLAFDQVYKLSTDYASNTVSRLWEYSSVVDGAPGQSRYVDQYTNTSTKDEVHVVVVDEDGLISGTPNTVLEVFKNVSRATDAKTSDGASNFYKTVLNNQSAFVWAASDITGMVTAAAASLSTVAGTVKVYSASFGSGADGVTESTLGFGDLAKAYDLFKSSETVDISMVLTGKSRGGTHGEQLGNYLIDNIAEERKDCLVFISPQSNDVVNVVNGSATQNVVEFRNALRSSSYGVMDSGYKYMYDKYNDVYRYVPLNGSIAGTCVRTDQTNDPWWSPAGAQRGGIKNVVKLAFNPTKADRDILYKNGVNPVVTFPGQGTILYGDKTLLNRPSAFDRINVRRLFIVLEKAIAKAAQSTLFEFNDTFTRNQFKNLVEPFLREVKGRRGIYDFKVICDETNNTPEVIDSNQFVGDIYIKPARSINFIQLNFIAVRTGVEFNEIIGNT